MKGSPKQALYEKRQMDEKYTCAIACTLVSPSCGCLFKPRQSITPPSRHSAGLFAVSCSFTRIKETRLFGQTSITPPPNSLSLPRPAGGGFSSWQRNVFHLSHGEADFTPSVYYKMLDQLICRNPQNSFPFPPTVEMHQSAGN